MLLFKVKRELKVKMEITYQLNFLIDLIYSLPMITHKTRNQQF